MWKVNGLTPDLKFKGIPFHNKQFQRLQFLLYNGINQKENEFRQIFLNHLVEDFEKHEGELTWKQRNNIKTQFEEEIFHNYEHLQCLEDILENLEHDYGFFKKQKKEVSLEWVDKEAKRAREKFAQISPEEAREQRLFVEKEGKNHTKFLKIGRLNSRFGKL